MDLRLVARMLGLGHLDRREGGGDAILRQDVGYGRTPSSMPTRMNSVLVSFSRLWYSTAPGLVERSSGHGGAVTA